MGRESRFYIRREIVPGDLVWRKIELVVNLDASRWRTTGRVIRTRYLIIFRCNQFPVII